MTPTVRPGPLPDDALLVGYRESGAFTDCWITDLPRPVSQAAFIEAFYTTRLFKLERHLLGAFASRPSSDAEAVELAASRRDAFAAWSVEARSEHQLLMCDVTRRTRSWLHTAPIEGGTRLHFGSAVVPRRDRRTGATSMGAGFHALIGFHAVYSRALLSAARSRLMA
ncbi:MAG: hypothetical protein ACOYLX_16405 [Burkholderiaceae bacterium]|jgi:hypothetical protein